jgi:glyoxylase-like metal-dependent hydrolase (beta-lactamase superfamily II)
MSGWGLLRAWLCSALPLFLLPAPTHAAVGDVGVYTSSVRSYSTATYWIEGVDGVVLVDTQFLPKEGLLALQEAERATGKKVTTAVVLHPNPDKFNGTAALQARGVRVITAAQVKALIPAVHQIRLGWFFEDYKPDYPRDAAVPDVFGDRTTTLSLAGLPLTLHVLGAGASGAHVVVQLGDAVFVGDLVNPGYHAWLELGLVGPWLQRLAEVQALKPTQVYPGRGAAGGPAMLAEQAEYLQWVRSQVRSQGREESPRGELGFFTKLRLQSAIESRYPQRLLPIFMRDGLAALWNAERKAEAQGR